MNDVKFEHVPVLLKEAMELLAPKNGGIYLDGTIGGGGYAEEILKLSAPDGRLVGLDIDKAAIDAAGERLKAFGPRVNIIKASYADILHIADDLNVKFDGVVLDVGVSSPQFDAGERGFSFSKDAPLDMRMDTEGHLTASDIVNNDTEKELKDIFENLGEERFAARIAASIVEKREEKAIETTGELEEICFRAYPLKLRKGRIHPATRVFQALRIAVNGELDNLSRFLKEAPDALADGGRIVVVSYHSLEDRLVKTSFKGLAMGGGSKLLTKKPVCSSEEEISVNPRSRSAKLRAIQWHTQVPNT